MGHLRSMVLLITPLPHEVHANGIGVARPGIRAELGKDPALRSPRNRPPCTGLSSPTLFSMRQVAIRAESLSLSDALMIF